MKNVRQTLCFSLIISLFVTNISVAQEKSKILVFSKTVGFRHDCIEDGITSLKKLGAENNFQIYATEDSEEFAKIVNDFDAVLFLNTTGDIFDEEQQKAFEKYIKNGGGFIGIHSATDTEYDWPWYGKLVGAYFLGHPEQQNATLTILDKTHPATSFLGNTWNKYDEWYNFKNINSAISVLINLEESSYKGGENGDNHPISWYHEYEGGKIFYTGLGHTKESYTDPIFLKHVLGGIQYVLAD
jgi:type 1 glutamine amidotransferase